MKINKLSNKLIKPQTPTPPNLNNYHISFIDQHMSTVNVGVVLFYKTKPDDDSQLEESLAKILVQFYPLAGRHIKKDLMVDCSDQGAQFVTAEVLNVELLDLVGKIEQLEDLFPDHHMSVDADVDDPILSIQVTHFHCGGAAITISVSHRVLDGASIGTFVAAWSDATNPDKTVGLTPSFDLPSLLPNKKDGIIGRMPNQSPTLGIKSLVFNEVALRSLKSKIRPKTISGVRVVTAVIAEALIRVDRAKHGRTRDFVLIQAVNMRERTIQPRSKHSCGNFFVLPTTRRVAAAEAHEVIGVEGLADLIGDSVRKAITDHADILSPDKDGRDIITNGWGKLKKEYLNPDTNIIYFSDWSKFGFYEADFGWGEPVWAGPGPQRPPINSTFLMSNEEGNWMEACVYVDQNDMRCFEEDELIKSFSV